MASFMNTSFAKKLKGTRKSMKPASAKAVAKAAEGIPKDAPPPTSEWTTQQAHATRDMMKAVDYMYQYNPNFDAVGIKQKVPRIVQKQIDLLHHASTHMAVVNYFRFDKCPQGVLHFVQQYLDSLDPPVMSKKLSQELLAIIACVDPLERIRQFRRILESAPVRTFMRKLFLYFHYLVGEASDADAALANIVRMFTGCFFRDAMQSSSKYKRRKRAMQFLIQRAPLVFEDSCSPEEEEDVPLVVTADRGLGTDGLLFLIDRKCEDVHKGFADMDYGSDSHGLKQELLALRQQMADIGGRLEGIGAAQESLDDKFGGVWRECDKIVEMVARTYEQLPRELPDDEDDLKDEAEEEDGEEERSCPPADGDEGDDGELSDAMRMLDDVQAG